MATHPCYYLGYALGATLIGVSIFVESAPVEYAHYGLGVLAVTSITQDFRKIRKKQADSSQQEQEAEKS